VSYRATRCLIATDYLRHLPYANNYIVSDPETTHRKFIIHPVGIRHLSEIRCKVLSLPEQRFPRCMQPSYLMNCKTLRDCLCQPLFRYNRGHKDSKCEDPELPRCHPKFKVGEMFVGPQVSFTNDKKPQQARAYTVHIHRSLP
jgi:hypothetical protein